MVCPKCGSTMKKEIIKIDGKKAVIWTCIHCHHTKTK